MKLTRIKIDSIVQLLLYVKTVEKYKYTRLTVKKKNVFIEDPNEIDNTLLYPEIMYCYVNK